MPRSKHVRIVAMLSASLTSIVVTPAIGQQPRATGETVSPELPSVRRQIVSFLAVSRRRFYQ